MLQHGAYTLLLDACYDRERFPTIEEAIDWCWASSEDEKNAVKFVLERFFDLSEDGIYIQNRIQDEIDKFRENSKINQRIAIDREKKKREKRTKRAKKITDREPVVHEPTTLEHEPPPNQEPLTINQEPLTNIEEPKGSMSGKPDKMQNRIVRVFENWKVVMNKNGSTILTDKRKKAIGGRLKEGYSEEFIAQAVNGCSLTPHNMGRNENNMIYNDIELICRNGENLERFAGKIDNAPVNDMSATTQRNISTIQNWRPPQ